MNPAPFQAPPLEQLTALLPAYQFTGFIAQGGMGAVYRARQLSLDREVAIKVLPRELGSDPEFRASFESEARSMARLNHANLIGVYDYGDIDGMPYIVMELVTGESLHEAAYGQAVHPEQAIAIVRGICAGLGHAHQHGIAHRDIKPANILLTPDAQPKIGDFGLAHPADAEGPGLVMGTPGYTAPEVYLDAHNAGPLADLFAVGVILHQLLTGIDPAGQEGPPTSSCGNVRLDGIWKKATNADPTQRYQQAEAIAADLDRWLDAKRRADAEAASPALRGQSAKQLKSARGGGGGIVFLVILLLAGGLGYLGYEKYYKPSIADREAEAGDVPEDAVKLSPAAREAADPALYQTTADLMAEIVAQQDERLAQNFADFRQDLGALETSIPPGLQQTYRRLRDLEGPRLPDPGELPGIDGFEPLSRLHTRHYARQEASDKSFEQSLRSLRRSYKGGLDRLAARADEAGDTARALALRKQALVTENLDQWVAEMGPE